MDSEMSREKSWLYEVEGMHEYKGVLCMPDSTPEVMHWMEHELTLGPLDVLLCAYPCSGDVWLQEVVWHIFNRDKIGEQVSTIGTRVPHIDHEFLGNRHPREFIQRTKSPRVVKARKPAHLLSRHVQGPAKVIYWVLDPRETLLNYHKLYNTLGKHLQFPEISFEGFFELFKARQLFEGDWFEMTRGFLSQAEEPNVLVLRYEEEEIDPIGTIHKVAEFLGVQLPGDEVLKLVELFPMDQKIGWQGKFTDEMLDWYKKTYAEQMEGTLLENVYI